MVSLLWVMPDMKQAAQNVWWLKNEFNIGIPESNIYVAPVYPSLVLWKTFHC